MAAENEDYFDSVLCVQCKKNYWSDKDSKLCKQCQGINAQNESRQNFEKMLLRKSTEKSKVLILPGHKY